MIAIIKKAAVTPKNHPIASFNISLPKMRLYKVRLAEAKSPAGIESKNHSFETVISISLYSSAREFTMFQLLIRFNHFGVFQLLWVKLLSHHSH